MNVGQDFAAANGGLEERHEVKFAAYEHEYDRLKVWLQMHPLAFRVPYPSRQVNNVYFDTWDYRAYAENLAGVSQRSKLRYRWYSESLTPDVGSLEVKRKRNHFGWKLRYPIANVTWSDHSTWADIRHAMRASLSPGAWLWFDQNPQPMMINRYCRDYFVSSDGRIRATLDTNQRVYDQRSAAHLNVTRPAVMQKTLVVEFKFARADRQAAVELLAKMPLRVGRHSKYMNAMRAAAFV